jgi:hypothetical protein
MLERAYRPDARVASVRWPQFLLFEGVKDVEPFPGYEPIFLGIE